MTWDPDSARRVCEDWARTVLADATNVWERAKAAGVLIAGLLASDDREHTQHLIVRAINSIPFDAQRDGLDGLRSGLHKGRQLMGLDWLPRQRGTHDE